MSATIPSDVVSCSPLDIVSDHPDGFSPSAVGGSDQRDLSLCVTELGLRPAAHPGSRNVLHAASAPWRSHRYPTVRHDLSVRYRNTLPCFHETRREPSYEWEPLGVHGYAQVAMEASRIYRKPVGHVRSDGELKPILTDLRVHGLIRAGFVLEPATQDLRAPTRTGRRSVSEQANHIYRIEKTPEDGSSACVVGAAPRKRSAPPRHPSSPPPFTSQQTALLTKTLARITSTPLEPGHWPSRPQGKSPNSYQPGREARGRRQIQFLSDSSGDPSNRFRNGIRIGHPHWRAVHPA